MWLHRKSESKSPTEVQCYWTKPVLGTIGIEKKFIEATELYENNSDSDTEIQLEALQGDTVEFFNNIMKKASEKNIDSQISRHLFSLRERELYSLSIHELMIEFTKTGKTTADEFIRFSISKMTQDKCTEVEINTRDQNNSFLWHELRYGRITASILYEATRCKTTDGSLVFKILGAHKKFDTEAMERGRRLEKLVIKEAEKKFKKKLIPTGFYLIQQFPVIGASPDAREDDFVVEVKCPSEEKSIKNFLLNGKITPQYHAQIQLQMFAAGTQKGLFCVADPKFEENKIFYHDWINFDSNYVDALLKKSINFWKKNVFVKLNK